ncbi:MAG: hypothetical protein U0324_15240 [Polyangiales bacterium]
MGAPVYTRHDPSGAALHGLVRRHLATFLAVAAERRGGALPRYVAEEFRA